MSMDLIQHLSDNMTNSPKDLLVYIDYYHYSTSQEFEDTAFLVRNQIDLNMWIEMWDGDSESVNETNLKLKTWKVELGLMDVNEFLDMAALDDKDALEALFGHEMSKRTLFELDEAMRDGFKYEELYRRHLENPLIRMEYLMY